ncbi:hypothetical protein HPO96_02545 [Kribbella sandramycini]|uniref:Uncharacterized protein n=1 Tax=Kribbella sandramycini TaxID=60450 RepID=A0A7Y4KWG2_9ACTN|nr:hypothetical protein [Kribbella sandramycini]MBB6568291.1 hypothetical protein [Kribbella sandramycini]NOL39116.1 hypothetical protein [Kribbella sandramycini]
MNLQRYEHAHLTGIVALCEAEGWPSLGADLHRAHATLTAPGVTTVAALDGDLVTDTAEPFYRSYEHHRTFTGFRLYP